MKQEPGQPLPSPPPSPPVAFVGAPLSWSPPHVRHFRYPLPSTPWPFAESNVPLAPVIVTAAIRLDRESTPSPLDNLHSPPSPHPPLPIAQPLPPRHRPDTPPPPQAKHSYIRTLSIAIAAAATAAALLDGPTSFCLLQPPSANALTVAPPPINAYAQRRQARAYQLYMRELEQRFEAMSAADIRTVVEKGGGGITVGYRVAGLSAFLASACSTAIVHPLDTLKTRIQARASSRKHARRRDTETTPASHQQLAAVAAPALHSPHSPPHALSTLPLSAPTTVGSQANKHATASNDDDLWVDLYSGVQSNIMKEAPNAAIYLGVYEFIKTVLLSTTLFHDLPVLAFMIAGCLGDAVGSVVRVPAEIVNKRLQLGYNEHWKDAVHDAFLTPEGRQSTALSWQAILWRDVPFGGLQIALYEFGHQFVRMHTNLPLHPGVTADIIVGSFAGTISAILTTPADVLVTRLSVQNPQSYLETRRYMSVWSTLSRIVKDDNLGGLFVGFLQRGIYFAPLSALFFSLYEMSTHVVSNPHDALLAISALQNNISQYLEGSLSLSLQALQHFLPAFIRFAAIASY